MAVLTEPTPQRLFTALRPSAPRRNGSVLRVRHSPCNWLQVNENETDPIHLSFLHTRLFGVQFEPVYGEIPTMEWMETPTGMIYITVRRWGEYLYLRTNDMLLPNAVRVAGINDGEGDTLFDRRGSTFSWVVPVDDTRCFSIGWSDIDKELAIPGGTGYVDRRSSRGAYVVGAGDVGQTGAPAYEERQRAPGDWDAWVSQGPITLHSREHLGSTDRGVIMYRKLVRRGIRVVAEGHAPKGVHFEGTGEAPHLLQQHRGPDPGARRSGGGPAPADRIRARGDEAHPRRRVFQGGAGLRRPPGPRGDSARPRLIAWRPHGRGLEKQRQHPDTGADPVPVQRPVRAVCAHTS